MKLTITQSRYTFPTLTSDKGMVGSVRDMKDAEYIVSAVNQHEELIRKVEELEQENKRLRGIKSNVGQKSR